MLNLPASARETARRVHAIVVAASVVDVALVKICH